jgi:ferredoxin
MRVVLDEEECLGYANCVLEAPDLFDIDDDTGQAVILVDPVPEDRAEAARAAVKVCPSRALSLEE